MFRSFSSIERRAQETDLMDSRTASGGQRVRDFRTRRAGVGKTYEIHGNSFFFRKKWGKHVNEWQPISDKY